MVRPRVIHSRPSIDPGSRYLIIDGYVDEPAALGVPPYLSPQARSMAGGFIEGGAQQDEIGYVTIDQMRASGDLEWFREMGSLEWTVILLGCIVPGKYLRGTPISRREVEWIISDQNGTSFAATGPAVPSIGDLQIDTVSGDPGVLCSSLASSGSTADRSSTMEEWNHHLLEGAFIAREHPDHPSPLICEIETMRGCTRYISGGCSFCSEPGKGPLRTRDPESVIFEVKALASFGVENIRVGGQSDLMAYGSDDIGRSETPTPDPDSLVELMSGVKNALQSGKGVKAGARNGRRIGIDTGIVHTDNANPAVIAAYPEESSKVLEAILDGTTPGTVLALGLESSDPVVKEKNNLNSDPDEVMEAVELMNRIGRGKGANGMPHLLPGLNFLGGLPGQTPDSFDLDMELLRKMNDRDLLLRRINIRGARFKEKDGSLGTPFLKGTILKAFRKFKEEVRAKVDPLFLKRMLPEGRVMKGVLVEASSGGTFFGRQIGSYPILVGIEHRVGVGEFLDIVVTEHSSRSLTGFRTPFRINDVSFRDLQALPGVGKKRAASLFRKMPLKREDIEEMEGVPDWLVKNMVFSGK